jgi:hypothetical protein
VSDHTTSPTIAIVAPTATIERASWPDSIRFDRWVAQGEFASSARDNGYVVREIDPGFVTRDELRDVITGVDAVVVAPLIRGDGADSDASGSDIAELVAEMLNDVSPDAHVVGMTSFLVGQDQAPAAEKFNRGIWAMAAFERELRARWHRWTFVRHTWVIPASATDSYAIELSQDPLIDGFVTTADVARVVLTAIQRPDLAAGVTVTAYDVAASDESLPLERQFEALNPDLEALVRA